MDQQLTKLGVCPGAISYKRDVKGAEVEPAATSLLLTKKQKANKARQTVAWDGYCDEQPSNYLQSMLHKSSTDSIAWEPVPCLPGTTSYGDACCARTRNPNGQPDFSDNDVRPYSSCDSSTAQFIANAMCLGSRNCTLAVNGSKIFTWEKGSEVVGTKLACGYTSYTPPDEAEADAADSTFLLAKKPTPMCRVSLDRLQPGTNFSKCHGERSLKIVGTCQTPGVETYWGTFAKPDMAAIFGSLDACMCAFLLLAFSWLKEKEKREVDAVDDALCTAADYTVRFFSIPPQSEMVPDGEGGLRREPMSLHDYEEKIKAHLERTLTAHAQAELTRSRGMLASPPSERELSAVKVHVADINFAQNNQESLRAHRKRGKVARKLDLIMEQKAMLKDQKPKSCGSSRLHHIEIQESRAKAEFLEYQNVINMAAANSNIRVVAIFVTFESDEDCDRCKSVYKNRGLLTRCFQKYDQRLDGMLLLCNNAREPLDLIWENLGHPFMTVLWRKTISYVFTVVFLACSFALILQSHKAQAELAGVYGEMDCYSSLVTPVPPTRPDGTSYTAATWKPTGNLITKFDVERDLFPEAFNLTMGNTGKLPCFCKGIKQKTDFSDCSDKSFVCDPFRIYDYVFDVPPNEPAQKPEFCRDWLYDDTREYVITQVSVVSIVVINLSLKNVLRGLVELEGPESRTGAIVSLIGKLFLALFLNTALLTLVINGSLSSLTGGSTYVENVLSLLFLMDGKFGDFGEAWYLTVGTGIMLTMIISIFSAQITKVVALTKLGVAQCADRGFRFQKRSCKPFCDSGEHITHKASQKALEELYLGPEFTLEERYATLLNQFFVNMMYNAGMPVLTIVSLFSYMFNFAFDKWMFLRLYRLPPTLDATAAIFTTSLLPAAVFVHMLFSMWMYSNPKIFEKSLSLSDITPDMTYNFTNVTTLHANATNVMAAQLYSKAAYEEYSSLLAGSMSSPVFSRLASTKANALTFALFTVMLLFYIIKVCLGMFPKVSSHAADAAKKYAKKRASVMLPLEDEDGAKKSRCGFCRGAKKTDDGSDDSDSDGDSDDEIKETTPCCAKCMCWPKAHGSIAMLRAQHNDLQTDEETLESVEAEMEREAKAKEIRAINRRLRKEGKDALDEDVLDGDVNPLYFEGITSERLGRAIGNKILRPEVLERYAEVLKERSGENYEPPGRVLTGLESYNLHANSQYLSAFALDSKSIVLYDAGKLKISQADVEVATQHAGLMAKCLGFFHKKTVVGSHFPRPSFIPVDERESTAIVGIPPDRDMYGPLIVVNFKVPNNMFMLKPDPERDETEIEETEEPVIVGCAFPGLGHVKVALPKGLGAAGIPEVQIAFPAADLEPPEKPFCQQLFPCAAGPGSVKEEEEVQGGTGSSGGTDVEEGGGAPAATVSDEPEPAAEEDGAPAEAGDGLAEEGGALEEDTRVEEVDAPEPEADDASAEDTLAPPENEPAPALAVEEDATAVPVDEVSFTDPADEEPPEPPAEKEAEGEGEGETKGEEEEVPERESSTSGMLSGGDGGGDSQSGVEMGVLSAGAPKGDRPTPTTKESLGVDAPDAPRGPRTLKVIEKTLLIPASAGSKHKTGKRAFDFVQRQPFLAEAPEEVINTSARIPVGIPTVGRFQVQWPRRARHHDLIQFHLPALPYDKQDSVLGMKKATKKVSKSAAKKPVASRLGHYDDCSVVRPNYGPDKVPTRHYGTTRVMSECGWATVLPDVDDESLVVANTPKQKPKSKRHALAAAASHGTEIVTNAPPSKAEAVLAGKDGKHVTVHFQVQAFRPEPVVKDFIDVSQVLLDLPPDVAIVSALPHQQPHAMPISCTLKLNAHGTPDRQQGRVDIPGVGIGVKAMVLASDLVSVQGMWGRQCVTRGFLPWPEDWTKPRKGKKPLELAATVPFVDEIYFEYPAIELDPAPPTGCCAGKKGNKAHQMFLADLEREKKLGHGGGAGEGSPLPQAALPVEAASPAESSPQTVPPAEPLEEGGAPAEATSDASAGEQGTYKGHTLHMHEVHAVANQAAEDGSDMVVQVPSFGNMHVQFPKDTLKDKTAITFPLPSIEAPMFGTANNELETFQARRIRVVKEEIARKKCCGEGGEQHVEGRQIGWVMLALNKEPGSGEPRSVLLLPAMVSFEAYQRAIVAVLGVEDDDVPVHEQRPSTAGEVEEYLMSLVEKDGKE